MLIKHKNNKDFSIMDIFGNKTGNKCYSPDVCSLLVDKNITNITINIKGHSWVSDS